MLAEAPNLGDIQKQAGIKLSFTDPGGLISAVLPYVFGAAGIALLLYLVFGGFQLMMSRGDPKAMQAAQGKITNAIIGFVIIIIAFFVVSLLGQLFGIKQFVNIFPPGGPVSPFGPK